MEPATRTRLISLGVLLAIVVPLIVIAAAGSGSEEESRQDGLRIEPSAQGSPELLVYLRDPKMNRPATTGGAQQVTIECTDEADTVVFTAWQPWPFSDTDSGTLDPHVHLTVDASILGSIARCSLKGTDPVLEGGRPRRR